jgi:hypothetical protein
VIAAFTARSWALLGSITVVVVAVLAFLITGSPDPDPAAAAPPAADPTPAAPATEKPKDDQPRTPVKERRERKPAKPAKPTAYVEVFNNSSITGLAGDVGGELSGAGWKVVGTDNWYGSIPATTVYYPARLKAQARLLADEVGATRMRPAVEPMRFDRLTLILTGDL